MHAIVSTHEEHIGHHVHNHDHALAVDNNLSPADQTESNTHSDHCHTHQCFTSVISDEVTLPSLVGMYLPPIGPFDRFVSILLFRIERPPKSSFA
ncbi:MAG: hypothetical protein OEV35_00085 [Gallionellaceae bacterium]|nr:hypothetical protein [Gallionellaceae bacterium]